MSRDVLFFPLDYVRKNELKQKENDVRSSVKAALISGTFTSLSIYLEFSMGYVVPLAALTAMLISCLYNETRRLAIMETIPLRDNHNNPSSPSSSNSSIHLSATHLYPAALALAQENISTNASPASSSTSTPIRRTAASAPPQSRRY